jgi:hypothetical protein
MTQFGIEGIKNHCYLIRYLKYIVACLQNLFPIFAAALIWFAMSFAKFLLYLLPLNSDNC